MFAVSMSLNLHEDMNLVLPEPQYPILAYLYLTKMEARSLQRRR